MKILTPIVASFYLVLCLAVPSRALPLQRDGALYRFGDKQFGIALDAGSGAFVELQADGKIVARGTGDAAPFDLKQDEKWLVGDLKTPFVLQSAQAENDTLVATLHGGDWQAICRYKLEPERKLLTRSAQITWQGKAATKLKGFAFHTPPVTLEKDGSYFLPGNYPPEKYAATALQNGRRRTSNRSLSPLIVTPRGGFSLAWLNDELSPNADRGNVTVIEQDGALHVSQNFNALALMPPGSTQSIGDACLWLPGGDGENALLHLHDWMKWKGHVVPQDRPAWFSDAILYSFHPGGTTGSGFKDLGGFKATLPLLDDIKNLGCNALWIMPVEDAGPYQPRDYYKLQAGLGTPDDYRALVKRAHDLGFNVLQDCVPHGGRNNFPRAVAHPEWLAYNEDGSTLDYWCFDFNWPTWRDYMAGVAKYYVQNFGVDGYRVDAVSGSKIPNWNPKIPYERASFAQMQGGLNMLHALRGAVKAEKPQVGGILAEVQGSVYGTASDAVYDFDLCYRVLPDARTLTGPVFVDRLRRWLHEQQYSEVENLLRLRHEESHDSLRSMLAYGPAAQRALMALCSWIDGIPLVYQEQETGSEDAFKNIFETRKKLPELSRGKSDYLSVKAPSGVFACLRTLGDNASLMLIDFGDEEAPSTARQATVSIPLAALPDTLRKGVAVGGRSDVKLADGVLTIPFQRRNYSYEVIPLRRQGKAAPQIGGGGKIALPQAREIHLQSGENQIAVTSGDCGVLINKTTGLPDSIVSGDATVWGAADLHLPLQVHATGPAQMSKDGDDVIFARPFGAAKLILRYTPTAQGVALETLWEGEAPAYAALYLPVMDAKSWHAASDTSGMNFFSGPYRVRHENTTGERGNIYWRPQGTNVIWDSLLHPFYQAGGSVGAATEKGFGSVLFGIGADLPARVQWTDRIGDQKTLGLLLAWNDPEAPIATSGFRITFASSGAARPEPSNALPVVEPIAGGWRVQNSFYGVDISRSGAILRLWSLRPPTTGRPAQKKLLIENSDLYTDNGFGEGRTRYGAAYDVETGARFWRESNVLKMRFEGQLRGSYRYDLQKPATLYRFDYAINDGPSFRLSSGVLPTAPPRGDTAFLAAQFRLPDLQQIRYRQNGASSEATIGKGRVAETANATETLPETIELRGEGDALLTISDLSHGANAPRNVFADGPNFFMAWLDGETEKDKNLRAKIGQWSWISGLWTPGATAPQAIGAAPDWTANIAPNELLRDAGFEQGVAAQPVSLRTGEIIPRPAPRGAWDMPSGGTLVSAPRHEGAVAAEVVDTTGEYLLWRQTLPLGEMPPSSRWRATAWVKGENIVRGDAGWKVGALRFAAQADKTQYISSPELLGAFDWKQTSVEFTVPPGLQRLSLEAGLNGATGKMWIDDVKLEKLP